MHDVAETLILTRGQLDLLLHLQHLYRCILKLSSPSFWTPLWSQTLKRDLRQPYVTRDKSVIRVSHGSMGRQLTAA